MRIGFDAKRFFHNTRGLGNYSRDTLRLLTENFPKNEYLLFNPKESHKFAVSMLKNVRELRPKSLIGKTIPSFWRSMEICSDIRKYKIDIFHGLSQELPIGIKRTGARSVVTFHDAIFIRYPELYPYYYRKIFEQKNKYSCRNADRIIAISEQSKRDAIDFFGADEKKISVVYQGCNSIFWNSVDNDKKQAVRKAYRLTNTFLLYVGAIEKRKNARLIIEALHRKSLEIPLLIVGKPSNYMYELKKIISDYKMEQQVIFRHNVDTADLPAIYSASAAFIYPSLFEGFGIPVLEALATGTAVITSRGSCFEETGGDAAIYVDPLDADELGEAIERVLTDNIVRNRMIAKGKEHAEKFRDDRIASSLMEVYDLLKH